MVKVYVSSTYSDLKDHREEVRTILRQLDCTDVAMEYYFAEDTRPVEKCLSDVGACDIYIGIFAWRYGWRPERDNPDDRSITHMEYLHAIACGKPCFIFILDKNFEWKLEKDEDSAMISNLRNELAELHGGKPFTNPGSLAAQVAVALSKWKNPLLIQNTLEREADEATHFFLQQQKGKDPISFKQHVLNAVTPKSSGSHVLVLQGMGGIGKSFLAQEVANGFCREKGIPRFNIVWWIDSDGMSKQLSDPNDDALNDLAELARRLPQVNGKQAVDLRRKGWVQDLLAHLEVQYRFLLIFDNACDGNADDQLTPEQFAKRYFPKTNNADQQVIVTSRNSLWEEYGFKTLEMETWTIWDYNQYFRGLDYRVDDNIALNRIHTQLEGLALAAAIAVRYLQSNPKVTLASYADSLEKEAGLKDATDLKVPLRNYSRSIYVAMLIAYRRLSSDAKGLLHQLVLMGPDDIPVLKMAVNMNGSGLAANNPFLSLDRIREAAKELARAALIKQVSDMDEEYSIHRLIRFSVQQKLIEEQLKALKSTADATPAGQHGGGGNPNLILDSAASITIESFAGSTDRFKKDHYQFYRKLLPHIDAFTAYLMSRIEKEQVNITYKSGTGSVLQTLLRDAGKYCFEVGNLALALRLFDFALIWSDDNLHELHQINLDKAYGLMLQDRNEEALELSKAALKFYESDYNGSDRLAWVIESRNKIGKIFQRTGEFRDANTCIDKCLDELEQYGDAALNRSKRSGLLHDKAAAYWDHGVDQRKAYGIFQEAIDYKKEDRAVDDSNLYLNFSHMIKGVAHVLDNDYVLQRENHWMAFNCFSKHEDREYRRYSYTAFYLLHFAWDEIGWDNRAAALKDSTVIRMLKEYRRHMTILDGDIKFRIITSIVELREAVREPDAYAAEESYRSLMTLLEDKKHKISGRYIDDGTVAASAVLDYGLFLLEIGNPLALELLHKAEEMLQFIDEDGNTALVQYHRRQELETALRSAAGTGTDQNAFFLN